MENQDAASSESNSQPCPWKCSRGNVATLTLVTFLSLFPVSAQDRIDSFADSAPARIATLHVDRAGSEKRLARALLLLARSFWQAGPASKIIVNVSQEMLAEMIGTTRSRVIFS